MTTGCRGEAASSMGAGRQGSQGSCQRPEFCAVVCGAV